MKKNRANWKHRMLIIIPVAMKAQANRAFAEMTGNPADNQTFGTPLSFNEKLPATHLACFVSATELSRVTIEQQAHFKKAGVMWWRFGTNRRLKKSHTGRAKGRGKRVSIKDIGNQTRLKIISNTSAVSKKIIKEATKRL